MSRASQAQYVRLQNRLLEDVSFGRIRVIAVPDTLHVLVLCEEGVANTGNEHLAVVSKLITELSGGREKRTPATRAPNRTPRGTSEDILGGSLGGGGGGGGVGGRGSSSSSSESRRSGGWGSGGWGRQRSSTESLKLGPMTGCQSAGRSAP